MTAFTNVVLIAAGVTSTLIAGVFFGFLTSVNGGLGRLTDREYLRSMQSINRVILNPLFLGCFVGSALLLVLGCVLTLGKPAFLPLLLATLFQLIGVHGVTGGGNVPLNKRLDAIDLNTLDENGLAEARHWYEGPWNRLHAIRTWNGVIASGLLFWALLA